MCEKKSSPLFLCKQKHIPWTVPWCGGLDVWHFLCLDLWQKNKGGTLPGGGGWGGRTTQPIHPQGDLFFFFFLILFYHKGSLRGQFWKIVARRKKYYMETLQIFFLDMQLSPTVRPESTSPATQRKELARWRKKKYRIYFSKKHPFFCLYDGTVHFTFYIYTGISTTGISNRE